MRCNKCKRVVDATVLDKHGSDTGVCVPCVHLGHTAYWLGVDVDDLCTTSADERARRWAQPLARRASAARAAAALDAPAQRRRFFAEMRSAARSAMDDTDDDDDDVDTIDGFVIRSSAPTACAY